MRSSHREIIHQLVGGFKHNGLDYAGCTIGLLNVIARLQVTGRGPATLAFPGGESGRGCHCVEGMFRRGFDSLVVNRQVNDDGIDMSQRCRDGVVAGGVGGFIPGQYAVTNVDFADGGSAFSSSDRCLSVKATGSLHRTDKAGHVVTLNERAHGVDTVAYIAATDAGNGDHANDVDQPLPELVVIVADEVA